MKKELICDSKDGFWFHSIFHYQGAALMKEAIIIDDSDTDKYIDYINEKEIDKVIIDLFDSDIKTLEFVRKLPNIKYLKVWSNEKIDNTPLYSMKQLEFLDIINSGELDLSRFPKLRFFSTTRLDTITNLSEATSLESLKLANSTNVSNYSNLNFLRRLSNIKVLYLDNLHSQSLSNLNYAKRIKVLSLVNMTKLHDISEFTNNRLSISRLKFYNCSNIVDLSPIGMLTDLRYLSMTNIKRIESVSFIKALKNLDTLIISESKISDCNLTFMKDVKHVVVLPMKKDYYVTENAKKIKPSFITDEYHRVNSGNGGIDLWLRIDN